MLIGPIDTRVDKIGQGLSDDDGDDVTPDPPTNRKGKEKVNG
jgi:hypothetical protein